MNQQAKDGLRQLLEKTPEDRRSKKKMETKDMNTTHNTTTKCCFPCEEEGHQQGVMLKMQEAWTLCKEMSRKKQQGKQLLLVRDNVRTCTS
jgi:hypothetical protein